MLYIDTVLWINIFVYIYRAHLSGCSNSLIIEKVNFNHFQINSQRTKKYYLICKKTCIS